MPGFITGSEPYVPVVPQVIASPIPTESDMDKAKGLHYPTMAKDLFPEGVRVIEVQGDTKKIAADAQKSGTLDLAAGYVDLNPPQVLILLVPDKKCEAQALALQEGDARVVSLLSNVNDSPPDAGKSCNDVLRWLAAGHAN